MKQAARRILISLMLISFHFTIMGCATKIKSNGPLNAESKDSGLRYYMPANLLIVTADVKVVTEKKLSECLEITTKTKKEYTIHPPQTKIIKDYSNSYTIEIHPGALSADNIGIERTKMNLLKTVSLDSDGKTADVAVNTLKAVASVAGAAYGININPFSPDKILSQTAAPELAEGLKHLFLDYEPEKCNWKEVLKSDDIDNPKLLTRIDAFTLINNGLARQHYKNAISFELLVLDLEKQRQELYEKLKSSNANTSKLLKKSIDDINARIKIMLSDIDRNKQAFNKAVKEIEEDLEIGTKEKSYLVEKIFEIDDFPTSMDIKNGFDAIKISSFKSGAINRIQKNVEKEKMANSGLLTDNAIGNIVKAAIQDAIEEFSKDGAHIAHLGIQDSLEAITEKVSPFRTDTNVLFADKVAEAVIDFYTNNRAYERYRETFTELGFALSIDKFDHGFGAKLGKRPDTNDKESYIYYRDPIPVRIAIYNQKRNKCNENIDNQSDVPIENDCSKPDWKHFKDSSIDLFYTDHIPAKIPYKTSYFGKRKLDLAFSDSGILTDMSFTSAASANVLAEKAATGIPAAIDSFSTSLKKIDAIETTKSSIIETKLKRKLDSLNSQKKILDAKILLEGSNADIDLLKEQAHLDNLKNYYDKLYASVVAGDKAAIAEATSEINRDTGELKALSTYLDQLSSHSQGSIENINQILTIKEQIIGLQSQLGTQPNNELMKTQIETLQLQLTILQKLLEARQSIANQ